MKDMYYCPVRLVEVLHEGEYLGHKFTIVNRGHHPTAYVECKIEGVQGYDDKRLNGISVHGGFTYYDRANWPTTHDPSLLFLGWDYGHFEDFVCMGLSHFFLLDGKKWSTQEIYEEVKDVIHQLVALEEGGNK